jgi:hypothetical protein
MTPGFAKPRSELPWLPYEEQDRVIINAHNFTPAITYGWETPLSIAAVGDAVVSTEGTLVEARNLGQATDRVVNGVTFVGATTAGTFTSGGGAFVDTTLYRGGGIGAAFEAMLDCALFSNSGDVTRNVPLTGLTIGQSYLLQLFMMDSRSAATQARNQSASIAGHTITPVRMGDELSCICRFLATATTENVGINVLAPNATVPRIVNGYQVRLL